MPCYVYRVYRPYDNKTGLSVLSGSQPGAYSVRINKHIFNILLSRVSQKNCVKRCPEIEHPRSIRFLEVPESPAFFKDIELCFFLIIQVNDIINELS